MTFNSDFTKGAFMFNGLSFDTSISERKGCNYCLTGKTVNTNGSDFRIHADKDDKECFMYTSGEYKSIDIRYCPFCGRKLVK